MKEEPMQSQMTGTVLILKAFSNCLESTMSERPASTSQESDGDLTLPVPSGVTNMSNFLIPLS